MRTILAACLFVGCSSGSKSPTFLPGTTLQISGKYLDAAGSPIVDSRIAFRNLRKFAYIDESAATAAEVGQIFGNFILMAAFPFYFFYDPDPLSTNVDKSKYKEHANYFLSSTRTDATGAFTFPIKADAMLRDADGGINVVIVNEGATPARFGKYAFVVKHADTNLGELRLCSLGGIKTTEDATQVTFSWEAPTDAVAKYQMRIASNNTLVWAVETTTTSVSLPRWIFQDFKTQVAIEAFYEFSTERNRSCLTETTPFALATPDIPSSRGVRGAATQIPFKLTSLTDGKFDTPPYLEGFELQEITLDLGVERTFSNLALYNLSLKAASNFIVSGSADGSTWTPLDTIPETRFVAHTFAAPQTARWLKLSFGARLVDLQEIAIY